MKLWIGTSGYSYPEWKGSFYPAISPPRRCSGSTRRASPRWRSTRLPRRHLDALVRAGWRRLREVPLHACALSTPSRDIKRLKDCADPLAFFLGRADSSGPTAPRCCPSCRRSPRRTCRCSRNLTLLPREQRATFELRHAVARIDEVSTRRWRTRAPRCASPTARS